MIKTLKKHKMAGLIREAINSYPDGICFAYPNGMTILANPTMNRVCHALTGQTILNAEQTWQWLNSREPVQNGVRLEWFSYAEDGETNYLSNAEIPPIFELEDKTVWQFQRAELEIGGIAMYQYTAENITQLYEYSRKLYEMNQRTRAYHERQRVLLNNIAKTNEEKERLHAKIRIHDNFGRCLIATKNYLEANARGLVLSQQEAQALCEEWEYAISSMSDLSAVKNKNDSSAEAEILHVAELIGCKVVLDGKQPVERQPRLLLFAAIRKALTNAVRHAGADHLYVRIRQDQGSYQVTICDNGQSNARRIREGVGLGTLRTRLEQNGARMQTVCENGVKLILTLPKEG